MQHENEVINIALAKMRKALENYRVKEKATVEALLDQCHAMLELKNACETEQGGSAFKQLVIEELKMNYNVASRMCVVARRNKLCTLSTQLPPAVTTLYQIAKLSDDQIDIAVDAGVIHPQATWRQIDAHLDVVRGKPGRADKAVSKDEMVTATIVEHKPEPVQEVVVAPFTREISWEEVVGLTEFTTETLREAAADMMHPRHMVARRLEENRERLQSSLKILTKPERKKTLAAVVAILEHEQEVFEAEVKSNLPKYNRELEARLKAELAEQKKVTAALRKKVGAGFSRQDFKFIRGVLHSDRPVDEARRNKAFDLFLKLAPIFEQGV